MGAGEAASGITISRTALTPAASYLAKFGCVGLTVMLTLAAGTEPRGWGVNCIGSPRLINLTKLLNPARGDSLLQG